MVRRLFCLIGLILLSSNYSISQSFQDKRFKVGDTLLPKVLQGILAKSEVKGARTSVRNKAVILDFWSKYCSACISGFPELEKIQGENNENLAIYLITHNSLEQLTPLFANSAILQEVNLPIIVNDTILTKLFPHAGVPFRVWIDSEGIVRGLATAQNDVTRENIELLLNKSNPIIKEFPSQMDFDRDKPLVVEGNGRQWGHVQYYFMVMRGIVGYNGFRGTHLKDPITKEKIENSGQILNTSWIPGLFPESNHRKIVIRGTRSFGFFRPVEKNKIDAWLDSMTYSIEFILPQHLYSKRNLILTQELEKYFNIKTSVDSLKLECCIIYRTSPENRLISKGGPEILDEAKSGKKTMKNFIYSPHDTFKYLLTSHLWKTRDEPIIVDETGFIRDIKIDIEIESNLSNFTQLNIELAKYGLGIKKEFRMIDCFIIEDNE